MSQSLSTAAVVKVPNVSWLQLIVVVITPIRASFAVRNCTQVLNEVLDETDATPTRVDAAVAITEGAQDAESEKAL